MSHRKLIGVGIVTFLVLLASPIYCLLAYPVPRHVEAVRQSTLMGQEYLEEMSDKDSSEANGIPVLLKSAVTDPESRHWCEEGKDADATTAKTVLQSESFRRFVGGFDEVETSLGAEFFVLGSPSTRADLLKFNFEPVYQFCLDLGLAANLADLAGDKELQMLCHQMGIRVARRMKNENVPFLLQAAGYQALLKHYRLLEASLDSGLKPSAEQAEALSDLLSITGETARNRCERALAIELASVEKLQLDIDKGVGLDMNNFAGTGPSFTIPFYRDREFLTYRNLMGDIYAQLERGETPRMPVPAKDASYTWEVLIGEFGVLPAILLPDIGRFWSTIETERQMREVLLKRLSQTKGD